MIEVGCAGILVEDTFCGPMAALPPAGQLLALDEMPVKAGGCAANVAIDLAKQNVGVEVIGCVGTDSAAAGLAAKLEARGVGVGRLIPVADLPTSKTVILLVAGEDRRYLHIFGANRAFRVSQIPLDWVASLKVFYLGGLCVMPGIQLDELGGLLKFCRTQGVKTVVDVVVPQGFTASADLLPLLPHIDYFLPNSDEARILTGAADPLEQARCLQNAGAKAVIITCGEGGALASRGAEYWRSGAHQAPVIDPSGAGDAFASGVIIGILRGWDMPAILTFATALGLSATRAVGTTDGVFNAAEAEEFINDHPLEILAGKL
jgi:sugar/nucleoside kinase (ribokinase family)